MHNIAVIGCGAIGLTSALAIQNTVPGANVTIFAKDFTPETTSDVAAGLWEPFLLGNTPQDKIYSWAKITYDYVMDLWKRGKAKEAGISFQPAIWLTDDENCTIPNWIDIPLGYHEVTSEQLSKLRLKYKQNYTKGVSFVSFAWEGVIFLLYLQQEFLKIGGRIFKKEIRDFEELAGYDIIVNCTGLGAEKLADDRFMQPIRGQIIKVEAPWIKHMILNDTKDDFCYIIPNIYNVTLGGTKQEDSNLNVDDKDANYILRKCIKLDPALNSSEIMKHQVGLRPGRDRVRLDVEIKGSEKNGKGSLKIVHNYGHGGAGITLAVGCAQETALLVRKIITAQSDDDDNEKIRGALQAKL